MRTQTRSRIVRHITEEEGARPIELVKKLGISPQAIHRHLRALLAAGHLERRGRGPQTRYFVAGIPRLERVRRWLGSAGKPAVGDAEFLCETRDVFMARLNHLGSFSKVGLRGSELALAIAVAGEVGNNSFDHNLGNWRDIPGCWFETQFTGGRLWICIADRGQGVLRSLRRADPTLADEQTALVTAFERILSGRAPENRGNGLKFVRNIILAGQGRGLACRSGAGLVEYGRLGADCRTLLEPFPSRPGGTITLLLWRLK